MDDEREFPSKGDERPTLPPPPEWRESNERSERGRTDSGETGGDCWYVAFGPLKSEQVRELLERSPEEIAAQRCYLLNRAKGTWSQKKDLDDLEPCGSEKKTAPPPPPHEAPPPPSPRGASSPPAVKPPPLPSVPGEPVQLPPLRTERPTSPPAVKPPPLPSAPAEPPQPPPLPVEETSGPPAVRPPPLPVEETSGSPQKHPDPEEETLEPIERVLGPEPEDSRVSNHEIRGRAYIDPASGVLRIDERESNRVTFKASVTVSSDCNFWTGIASDISGGGLFVATYNTVPIGSRVSLDFSMPDDGPRIRAVGEVVWQRIFREDNELIPGMGVRFVHLSDQDKERIGAFVENRETLLFEE